MNKTKREKGFQEDNENRRGEHESRKSAAEGKGCFRLSWKRASAGRAEQGKESEHINSVRRKTMLIFSSI